MLPRIRNIYNGARRTERSELAALTWTHNQNIIHILYV